MDSGYKRVLLKISGEALAGKQGFGIDPDTVEWVAEEIKRALSKYKVEVALVIGGGNFMRGAQVSKQGIERTTADYMGMLSTVINALGFQDQMERKGLPTRVLSAIKMEQLCEQYIRRRAMRHIEKGRVIIFAGGTGNPYFSTDTAAVLRAIEIDADVVMKATNVDGVYDKDPKKFSDAKFLTKLSYEKALEDDIKVMDDTAIALAKDNNLPIRVFKLLEKGNFEKVLGGIEGIGSTVKKS